MTELQEQLHELNQEMERSHFNEITDHITDAMILDNDLGNILSTYMSAYPVTPPTAKHQLELDTKKQLDQCFYAQGIPQNHYEKPEEGCEPRPFANLWVLNMNQYLQQNY